MLKILSPKNILTILFLSVFSFQQAATKDTVLSDGLPANKTLKESGNVSENLMNDTIKHGNIAALDDDFIIHYEWNFEDQLLGRYEKEKIRADFDPQNYVYTAPVDIVEDRINNQSTKVMRITNWPNELWHGFGMNVPLDREFDEVYLTYHVKFSNEFNSTAGGKLSGLVGLPQDPQMGPECPRSGYGFVAHNMYKQAGSLISYHYDRTEHGFEECPWANDEYLYNDIYFNNGTWYNITQRLVLNSFTNGVPNPDGIKELWVDGKLIFQETNLLLMEDESTDMKIDGVRIAQYYGGTADDYIPLEECYSYIDNIIVWSPSNDSIISYELHDPYSLMISPLEITDRRVYYDSLRTVPGELNNSEYGGTYSNCIDEAYLVDAGAGNSANFTFNLKLGRGDVLFVYDGNTTDAELLYKVAGGAELNNQTVQSTGRYMFIRFSTDNNSAWLGWNGVLTFSEVPAIPTNLISNSVSTGQIGLAWTDNSDNENGFEIQRAVGNGSFSALAHPNRNSTTYVDYTVLPATNYRYRIRAYNAFGNSGYSEILSVTTPQAIMLPDAPSNLKVNLKGSNFIRLSWADNSSYENGFQLQRSLGNEGFQTVEFLSENVKQYQDIGLEAETTYKYRIRAYSNDGYSDFSNTLVATTNSIVLNTPLAPSSLSLLQVNVDSLSFIWSDNSDNEDFFIVYRGLTPSDITAYDTLPANTSKFCDSNLTPDYTFYYQLAACNSAGSSSLSETLEITVVSNYEISMPVLTNQRITPNSVQLSWEDQNSEAISYILYRASTDCDTLVFENLTEHQFNDSALSTNQTYTYWLEGEDTYGNLMKSNINEARTLPSYIWDRVNDSLKALFLFGYRSNDLIRDQSWIGEPVNLLIQDTMGVKSSSDDYLDIEFGSLLRSNTPDKIINSSNSSGELSLEFWLKPGLASSLFPANIISLGNDNTQAFSLYLKPDDNNPDLIQYVANLTTKMTSANGKPDFLLKKPSEANTLQHIVFTHDAQGNEVFYLNNQIAASGFRSAGFYAPPDEYSLFVGNNELFNAPYSGGLYLGAVYSRALSAEEVAENYYASPFTNEAVILNPKKYIWYISPNPTQGKANLSFFPSDENTEVTVPHYIKVVNSHGLLIQVIDVTHYLNSNSLNLDLSEYPSGLYQLLLYSQAELIGRKILVLTN